MFQMLQRPYKNVANVAVPSKCCKCCGASKMLQMLQRLLKCCKCCRAFKMLQRVKICYKCERFSRTSGVLFALSHLCSEVIKTKCSLLCHLSICHFACAVATVKFCCSISQSIAAGKHIFFSQSAWISVLEDVSSIFQTNLDVDSPVLLALFLRQMAQ